MLALGIQRIMHFTKDIHPTINACTWKSKDIVLHQGHTTNSQCLHLEIKGQCVSPSPHITNS